jgi:nitrous oxidase accessory protein NosD
MEVIRILAGCMAALAVAVLSPGTALAAGPTTRVVDDDGVQCGNAEFRTIGAAVAAADPGDTVSVCAGVYRERVEVNKQVQLIGQRDAVERVKCVDQTWTSTDAVDPAAFPVIEPPDGQVGSLVRLQADGIELAGFVVQGQKDPGADGNLYAPAIQADGARSSHRIHHNLIQNNTFGIELGSNGATLSQVDHNCLRGNEGQWRTSATPRPTFALTTTRSSGRA